MGIYQILWWLNRHQILAVLYDNIRFSTMIGIPNDDTWHLQHGVKNLESE